MTAFAVCCFAVSKIVLASVCSRRLASSTPTAFATSHNAISMLPLTMAENVWPLVCCQVNKYKKLFTIFNLNINHLTNYFLFFILMTLLQYLVMFWRNGKQQRPSSTVPKEQSGLCCSKLTTSLVKERLNF